jgi:CRISPR-associated protein Cas6/Cse3/CasE subtype I-E
MFLSDVRIPKEVSTYEVHQHLHILFENGQRPFLFRREGESVQMVSIQPPKHPHKAIPLERFLAHHPYAFVSDLIITKAHQSRRYDVRDPDERRAWMRAKLAGMADVPFCRFQDKVITIKGGVKRIVAQATGTLIVKDTTAFAGLVQSGLGRGRAFGCGLVWMPALFGERA